MTAAAARAALASIGANLAALSGAPEERRGNGLLMRLEGVEPGQVSFDDLAAVPVWLRSSRKQQRRLALRVALLSIGPILAGSIDGRWLGAIATLAGEEMVDWAIQSNAQAAVATEADVETVEPARIEGLGFAMLRSQLGPAQHGYLAWAPSGEKTVENSRVVAGWIDLALAAEAA